MLENDVLFVSKYRIIPESLRWLNQHNKFEKAQAALRKIAEINKRPLPSIDILKKAANVDLNEEKRLKRYTYIDLFRYRIYVKRTIIIIALW